MALQISTQSWWETDEYTRDFVIAPELDGDVVGPNDVAIVRAYPSGQTQQGWGLTAKGSGEGFMPRYKRGEFLPRRALHGYERGRHNVALVMRSLRVVCVDIDGKNGGLQHASELGFLPATLAETSKSGTGYHLYYETEEHWDEDEGYGLIPDQIGIVQGVDIRGVGCVYHWPSQRWNSRPLAPLPPWFQEKLVAKKERVAQANAYITATLTTMDETEILLMQGTLLDELKKPIKPGSRNNTLFAIGSQMKNAQVPDWQLAIAGRGTQLGLGIDEVEKIVANIENYG